MSRIEGVDFIDLDLVPMIYWSKAMGMRLRSQRRKETQRRRARGEAKCTLPVAAKEAGCSEMALSKLERGVAPTVRMETLRAILEAINGDLKNLLGTAAIRRGFPSRQVRRHFPSRRVRKNLYN